MGHITSKNYLDLQKRLDKAPQGVPTSDALFKILEILFTEEEAKYVSVLPFKCFSPQKAAKIWKLSLPHAKKILNNLAEKGLLVDLNKGDKQLYVLAPSMAGFFEFSLMRTDGKFDRKILSELYYQYINVEHDFVEQVLGITPPVVRTIVHETAIQKKHETEVLDYERATHVIKTATCIGVGDCYCRHKMHHMGKACDMPIKVCLTFNNCAKSLTKHGIAKKISKKKAKEILDDCIKLGLVQIGDNIQEGLAFMCNCCGCCCEALLAYKELGYKKINETNFYAEVGNKCIGCGICEKKCPVDAIKIKKVKGKKVAHVLLDRCIGCGVCTRFCPTKTLLLERRSDLKQIPRDTFERFIMSAIEQNKLQNLIFDNYTIWTNEMFRRLFGFLFSLKPAKKLLASKQLQSKFFDACLKGKNSKFFNKLINK